VVSRIQCWFSLSRPAFHTVGMLPFILGTVMAWRLTGTFLLPIFLAGLLGAVLVMLAAYLAGEHGDIAEDRISAGLTRSRFAGGSGMVARSLIPARHALWGAYLSLVLAGIVGLALVFVWHTGPWTIPLGVIGMAGGFYYSSRPFRWVSSGIGEIWIAFCYGWLPVATGYYLQAGEFSPVIAGVSFPLALTIFSVILINEFPDHPADSAAGKRNLAVRLGLPRAAALYAGIAAVSWFAWLASILAGVPPIFLWLQAPVLVVSIALAGLMVKGAWVRPAILERLCGGTLLVDLGIAAAYVTSFLVGGM
jgi:1,4-dihydroxy-2-naphthoate octaprenyltransferase